MNHSGLGVGGASVCTRILTNSGCRTGLGESNGSETLISVMQFQLPSSVLTKLAAMWNVVETSLNVGIIIYFLKCVRVKNEWPCIEMKLSKLTGRGYEIEESLLGEQRVFQAPEVEFQDSGHRVDVLVRLVISQWILTCAVITYLSHTHTHLPPSRYRVSLFSPFRDLSLNGRHDSHRDATQATFVCTLAAWGRRLWLLRVNKTQFKFNGEKMTACTATHLVQMHF